MVSILFVWSSYGLCIIYNANFYVNYLISYNSILPTCKNAKLKINTLDKNNVKYLLNIVL